VRILVTGVSGFSGSFVARRLARTGHEVVGTYRSNTPFLARVANAGIKAVRIELAEAAYLPGPFDAVVHVAATSAAPRIDVARIVHDNVTSTAALADAAERWNSRAFVFFSSLSLYGDLAGPVVDESTPIINPEAYGATKHLGELLLAERAEHFPSLALRLPGIIGPGAHRNWMSKVSDKLRAGQVIRAFNLDKPFNNAAHIADIAALIEHVLTHPWRGFDALVLGARGAIPVREAIERLARGLGVSARIEEAPATKSPFMLSSERAICRWGYDPMDIGAMIDRYAKDVRDGE